ncbi:HAMP domain-containing histidine kinase [Alistipes sp. OttesenSCG-928-L06]|nr:HAMP domain-containing histidine kinase [Alistipes sp. OttesenSCG-928-L06]
MMFNTGTIRGTAIIISTLAAALSLLVTGLCGVSWPICLLVAAATGGLMFLGAGLAVRRYMILRIKPLYQLMLSKDIVTSRLTKELRERACDDVVQDVQRALDQLVGLDHDELERLKQKEKDRTEFLTAIFHEIRTPIFNIEGYTQTLLDGGLDDPEVNRTYLERTIRSVNRLAELVEDIDRIARYESGGVVLYKEPFCIVEVVDEVIDALIVSSQSKNVRYVFDTTGFPSRGPILVYADRLRISQAVEELLSNAIRYSPLNGQIRIVFLDMYDKILVEVSDQGVGIPPADIPRIFEPLYRVDKSRSRSGGGSGLGLTGVKRTIEAHDENATVRSEVGKGTTFSFTLRKRA